MGGNLNGMYKPPRVIDNAQEPFRLAASSFGVLLQLRLIDVLNGSAKSVKCALQQDE